MNTDAKKCQLYIINGAICDFIEWSNKYPTIEQVRNNPNVAIHCKEITDEEITNIINRVIEIDTRDFLHRHSWLSENKPDYYGYRVITKNGFQFVSNDDLCKKLGNRLFN